jgi:uncharacterized protein YuzB (UPF0349 family)
MKKAPARILKAGNVKFEGQFLLGAGQAKPGPSNEKNAGSCEPKVCVLEKNPKFSIVEITCSCGTKTCLKCEYADVEPSAGSSETPQSAPGASGDASDQAK